MPLNIVIAICPLCGSYTEWQGNDYGYLCQGPVEARHPEATAVPTPGTFHPRPASTGWIPGPVIPLTAILDYQVSVTGVQWLGERPAHVVHVNSDTRELLIELT